MSRLKEILRANANVQSLFVRRPVPPKDLFEIWDSVECRPFPIQCEELYGLELRFQMQKFVNTTGSISAKELVIDEFISRFKAELFGDSIDKIRLAMLKLKFCVGVDGLDCLRELERELQSIEML